MPIQLIPILISVVAAAPQIQQAIRNGTPILQALEKNGNLLSFFTQIGKQLFPGIDEKSAAAAAASAMFDPVRVKWLQTALNVLGTNPPLDVDGAYGPKTAEAVRQFQKSSGLEVDGWAGELTHGALQGAVSKAKTVRV